MRRKLWREMQWGKRRFAGSGASKRRDNNSIALGSVAMESGGGVSKSSASRGGREKREREKEEGREGEPKGLPFTQSWPCDCLGPSTAQKPRRPKPCQVSTPPWWRWLPAWRLVLTPGTLWNAPRGGIKEGRRLSWPPGPGLLTRYSLPAIQKHSKNYID